MTIFFIKLLGLFFAENEKLNFRVNLKSICVLPTLIHEFYYGTKRAAMIFWIACCSAANCMQNGDAFSMQKQFCCSLEIIK